MKNLLEYILIHLVKFPEDVSVIESKDDRGFLFTIHVNPEDVGRVIGKGGAVIHSIRTICKIRAIKEGIRAHVTIDDGSSETSQEETAPQVETEPEANTSEDDFFSETTETE